MTKFHWPLYSDIIFFVDHYSGWGGVSNKHCLLPFSIGIVSLRNMPMHYAIVFKGCKNDIFVDKNCAMFFSFAQNTDRGYTLEPI